MKVGILTYHEGLNHGAYLQAFATFRVLQEMGHSVEIINYKNREHWLKEDVRPWFKYRRPARFLDHWQKMRAFKRDQADMRLTPFTKKPEDVLSRHYDVVVIGSDVVWNYKIFGYDDLYFGGVNADRIVAYAPSFGWVNSLESMPPEVRDGIRRFDSISVRDENSAQIVWSLLKIEVPIVLDPTLIYDFQNDTRPVSCIDASVPYLLVYSYAATPEIISTAREYARRNGLKVYATGYRQSWCDKTLMCVGPLEWLSLMNHAHTILTSTFHGAIFSVKNSKPFFFVFTEKTKHRVATLLEICGIDIAIREQSKCSIKFFQTEDQNITGKLEAYAKPSRDWLKHALKR